MPDPVSARTVFVRDTDEISGTSQKTGKPWTMWKLIPGEGESIPTFDAALGKNLPLLVGKYADITVSTDKSGREKLMSAIESATESPPAETDVLTERRIAIQAGMRDATAQVNAEFPEKLTAAERVRRVKVLASELALWGEEWAQNVDTELPFEDDGIPFGDDVPEPPPPRHPADTR